MANAMKQNVIAISAWLTRAGKVLARYIEEGNVVEAVEMLEDIVAVVKTYIVVFGHINWAKLLLGGDPFKAAKIQAKAIADKWGFDNP